MDDIYVIVEPERVRVVYDMVAEALGRLTGIRLNEGKTRAWNKGGICPQDITALGEEVWNAEGVKVLGTPIGTAAFVARHLDERLEEEQRLWDAIPTVSERSYSRARPAGPSVSRSGLVRRNTEKVLSVNTRLRNAPSRQSSRSSVRTSPISIVKSGA